MGKVAGSLRRLTRPALALAACMALAMLLAPRAASAQVGQTTDILLGRVVGPDSQPLPGARVTAQSVETGVNRSATTNDRGRYTIVFPDGGGSYRLTITFVGMQPARVQVARQGDEDRIETDVSLGRTAVTLSAVTVRARPTPRQQGREVGGSETNLNPGLTNRLPVDAGDLAALATLAPGVIGIAGTDTTPASFSVAGQPPSANQITLDGLTFGSGSVPSEAVRSTRIVTSSYDVGRGQFTGGLVSSTTRSGTNTLQGAASYTLRDPSLQFGADPAAAFSQTYTQNQLSGGVGGPIVTDRAFWYSALQLSRRSDPLLSIANARAGVLERLGASPDSVRRFLSLVRGFGLPVAAPGELDDRRADNGSALTRLDVNLGESHTLTLRGDWHGQALDAQRVGPFAFPHTGGTGGTAGGGGMLTLTSHVNAFINELRAYTSAEHRHNDPYLDLPAGRVTVASALSDGQRAVTAFTFGGNAGLPQATRTGLVEAADELSWVSSGGAHRVKLGGLLDLDRSTSTNANNRLGTFTFASLADLEANRPTIFTRTLSPRLRSARSQNGALYLGDAWRVTRALQVTVGARAEATRVPLRPAYSVDVDTAFGRRTDRLPGELHASPRVGFSWSPATDSRRAGAAAGPLGGPSFSLRGGVGEFRSKPPTGLFAAALDATGLASGESQLTCYGATAPVPDWSAWQADPDAIPTSCEGGSGDPQPALAARRNVTLIDPSFEAPRAWRASLGASRRFLERFNVSLDFQYARGIRQSGAVDLNLDTTAAFRLADEGGRPVYVPAAAILPATGSPVFVASRLHPQFGTVSNYVSTLESDTRQGILSVQGLAWRGMLVNASYSYTRSRDEGLGFGGGGFGGFGGFGASTAGNPNLAEWGTSDQERRHAVLLSLIYPVTSSLDLTTIARAVSGQRYSPLVDADINGDGARNDRAFVFDPATASDPAVAAGMQRLLENAPSRARDCLRSQLGQVASRNACLGPWTPSFDLQLNARPASFGLDRRLTLSLIGSNVLAGLDQLLHGAGDLRGWGQPAIPDRTLLSVRGFDAGTQRYQYVVNEHFGAAGGSRNAVRIPFQLGLQARMSIGPDPARDQVRGVFGGGAGRGGRPTEEEFRNRLARAVPNTYRQILAANDSLALGLSDEQRARLTTLGDTLQLHADSLVADVAKMLAGAGGNPDPLAMFAKLRPRLEQGRALSAEAVERAKEVLTAEQWSRLPPRITSPLQGGPGQGRDGGRFGPPGGGNGGGPGGPPPGGR